MPDEEELLESGRKPVPRRLRIAALVVAALALAAVITVRVWPSGTHHAAISAAPTSSLSAPVVPPPPVQSSPTPPAWPLARGPCGTQVLLSRISASRSHPHTGLRLLVGGNQVRTLDFDSGQSRPDGPKVPRGQFSAPLLVGGHAYAVTGTCDRPLDLLRRLGIADSAWVVPHWADTVLTDGARVWFTSMPGTARQHGYVAPLGDARRVRLPAGFVPQAITHGELAGGTEQDDLGHSSVLLVDAATGRIRDTLRNASLLGAGSGVVAWTVGCDITLDKPCLAYLRPIAGGSTSTYRLPRPPFFTGGLSADGRQLAFTLERAGPDPLYQQIHPIPPSDVAVLALDTGRLEIVPGIEIPPKSPAALAFSPDGRWLLTAVDAGSTTRLLAWRPGLARPYETARGPAIYPPSIAVLQG